MMFPADRPPILADIWSLEPGIKSEDAHRVLDLARRMHRRKGGLEWDDIHKIAERQRRKRLTARGTASR